jgi:polar amino acid transport system substrate-binding protein
MGVQVQWVVQPFNTLLVAVNQDRFDLIATSFAVTPERMKAVDFVSPHYCTGATIVSKPNGPKTEKDLIGKVVVVPVGTVYSEPLKKISGIKEIRTVPNETDGLQNLLSGRADAWVTEQFVAFEAVKKHRATRIDTGEVILKQKNAMVVAKGNSTLLETVDRELKSLLKDGTYHRLSLKYFDKDIRCP